MTVFTRAKFMRESREKALGLLDVPPDVPRARERDDDFGDEDSEAGPESQASPSAGAAGKDKEKEGEPS